MFFFSENFHRDNFFNEITFEFTKNQTLPEFTSIEGCSEVCIVKIRKKFKVEIAKKLQGFWKLLGKKMHNNEFWVAI